MCVCVKERIDIPGKEMSYVCLRRIRTHSHINNTNRFGGAGCFGIERASANTDGTATTRPVEKMPNRCRRICVVCKMRYAHFFLTHMCRGMSVGCPWTFSSIRPVASHKCSSGLICPLRRRSPSNLMNVIYLRNFNALGARDTLAPAFSGSFNGQIPPSGVVIILMKNVRRVGYALQVRKTTLSG